MSASLYALCVALHGHAAWLGVASIAHAVALLGRPFEAGVAARARRMALLACGLVGLPWAAGAWIYPTYRVAAKPGLIARGDAAALAFEAKEHLAFLCLVLLLGGTGALLAGGAPVRRLSRRLLGAAFVCGVVVGVLGVLVGASTRPGWR